MGAMGSLERGSSVLVGPIPLAIGSREPEQDSQRTRSREPEQWGEKWTHERGVKDEANISSSVLGEKDGTIIGGPL